MTSTRLTIIKVLIYGNLNNITWLIMPSCTPPCHFVRPCRNFSDYVGIFPIIWEFFRLCGNFSDYVGIFPPIWEFFRLCGNFSNYVVIFPTMSHFQGGIFPTMSEFFPPCRNFSQFPSYMLENFLLVDGRDPRSIWCKKTLWVAVKIFLYLLRESSVICKAIFRKSAETLSFFLQCI